MVVVLLTVFFMGGGTISMLDRLQIARLTAEQELELDRSVRPVDRMKLLQFDSKYLVPFFTTLHDRKKIFSFAKSDEISDADVAATDDASIASDKIRAAMVASKE